MSDRATALHRLYEALESGAEADALACLADDVEWVEPAAPGYPLAGTHSGVDEVGDAVVGRLSGEMVVERVIADGAHGVASGRFHVDGIEVAFAHVCDVRDGKVERVRSFPDTSAFTPDEVRAELADLAERLLEEADALRRQCELLASGESGDSGDVVPVADADDDDAVRVHSNTSLRLEAVDLAQSGADEAAVEQFLMARLDDAAAVARVLEDVFPRRPRGANGGSTGRFGWARR